MASYQHIELEQRGAVRWLWLNRPEVRNAFNDALIADIASAFADVEASPDTRVVVLAARGNVFSAGADLNYMRAMANYRPCRQPGRRAQGRAHVQRRAFVFATRGGARAG
jgi:enoyl-CoA hydratase/carnithine racemase